jgi:carboxypeptidase Taq
MTGAGEAHNPGDTDVGGKGGPEGRNDVLKRLRELDKESRLLEHTAAILGWDQETYMPEEAVGERAQQQALLQRLVHDRNASPEVGELLAAVGSDGSSTEQGVADGATPAAGAGAIPGAASGATPAAGAGAIPGAASGATPAAGAGAIPGAAIGEGGADVSIDWDGAFLREKKRQYDQATKIPSRLVSEFAETASRGQHAWAGARRDDDFAQFKPWLEKLLGLSREMADALGHDGNRYDALLDQYEPYMTTTEVARVFGELKEGLVQIVEKISASEQVDTSFLDRSFPVDAQESISRTVMTALGYDTQRGRLDISAHPFTTTLGSNDVRITTRYDEHLLTSGLFSTIHETGHALYELGIAEEAAGSLLAEGTSLGIHESQSRMWENVIGRSRSFWSHWLPALKEFFPDQLSDVDLERFYRGINRVEPSLIRVEADEVTYSLHVILRFELEQLLVSGDLTVDDLPGAWNEKSKELLGIVPDDYAHGVLQDVHWSFGAFGYFPTYALGNLYAAQFLRVMERDMPRMWDEVSSGNTSGILSWLRNSIHRYGKARTATQLVEEISGESLNPGYFLDYLRNKYGEIYRF